MFDNVKKQPKTEIKYDAVLTEEQKNAKELILQTPVNFLIGKAGSAKTFLACAVGLDLLFKKQIEKIIITRPTVATEDNGFLPGTFEEKMEPWLIPIRDNMRTFYNKPDKLKELEHKKIIETVSLTHFRGRSFHNAFCIVDEFENLTHSQLKMAIGRLGKNSTMVFCGDADQIDLKRPIDSAFYSIERLQGSKYVSIIELKENHRHPAVEELLELLK